MDLGGFCVCWEKREAWEIQEMMSKVIKEIEMMKNKAKHMKDSSSTLYTFIVNRHSEHAGFTDTAARTGSCQQDAPALHTGFGFQSRFWKTQGRSPRCKSPLTLHRKLRLHHNARQGRNRWRLTESFQARWREACMGLVVGGEGSLASKTGRKRRGASRKRSESVHLRNWLQAMELCDCCVVKCERSVVWYPIRWPPTMNG